MKTIQKTPFFLLLIVFLTAAACNTPAVLGEISSPPAEAPAEGNLTVSPTPCLPENTNNETDEVTAPAQPQASGTVVFTAESAEPDIPAENNTLSFSADKSVPPNANDAPEQDAPEQDPQSADSLGLPTEITNPGSGCDVKGNATFEEILLNLINQERANQGLNPLVFNPQLIETARTHSLDMACENYFNHIGSDGSNPFSRIGASGYPYEAAGENIYAGSGPYNCAQEAFKAWMKSAGHQEVMLNQNFEEIGIGYAFNPGSTYGGYFTAVFASR